MSPPRSDILEALGSDDTERRREAVAAMGRDWQDEQSWVSLLFEALGDADWRVRRDATHLGERVAGDDFLAPILTGLAQGENVGLRNACIEVARAMGASCARALAAAATEADGAARRFYIQALGPARDEAVVEVLEDWMDAPDENLAVEAIEALARVGGHRAASTLRERLTRGSHVGRLTALEALEELGEHVPYELLETCAHDRLLWRATLPLLGRSNDARAVGPLIRGLGGSTPVAVEAARALCQLAETKPAAVGDAIRAADASVIRQHLLAADERAAASFAALCTMARDEQALPEILPYVLDEVMPRPGLNALRAWGSDAVDALLGVFSHESSRMRHEALRVAAELAAAGADVERSTSVRLACWSALDPQSAEGSGHEHLYEALAAVVRAEDAERLVAAALGTRRAEFAQVLGVLGRREPNAVDDVLASVRLEAGTASIVKVLGEVRGERAFDQLSQGLVIDDASVRCACVLALAAHGSRGAEALRFSLSDEEPSVRLEAARVLREIVPTGLDVDLDRLVSDVLEASS